MMDQVCKDYQRVQTTQEGSDNAGESVRYDLYISSKCTHRIYRVIEALPKFMLIQVGKLQSQA